MLSHVHYKNKNFNWHKCRLNETNASVSLLIFQAYLPRSITLYLRLKRLAIKVTSFPVRLPVCIIHIYPIKSSNVSLISHFGSYSTSVVIKSISNCAEISSHIFVYFLISPFTSFLSKSIVRTSSIS